MTDDSSTDRHARPGQSAPGRPMRLSDHGQLIAAIPHLLGFYPTDSIVLILVRNNLVFLTQRIDLPTSTLHDEQLAAQVANDVRQYADVDAIAFLVGDDADGNGRGERHRLAVHLWDAFARHGLVVDVYGVPTIAEGARWFDYGFPERTGTVPDPENSPMHAAAVARGLVTYPDRDALAATLQPDPDDVLKRREALMDTLAARPSSADPGTMQAETEQSFHLVRRQVEQVPDRTEPLTDQQIAELSIALADLWVRDRCLGFALGEHAPAAERLWTELTRQSPAPERAEAATLLAISAYLRGDGTLAALALDRAEAAHPHHRLASMVRGAMDLGMPPATIRGIAERAVGDQHDASREAVHHRPSK
ncbi:DUF4192 domain-containing protein [Actinosynnema sp. CS-041913]|uniref:DUF4192 domain-containing protein n=1 Tax=Actinosynnema sp. CS-041913 TaxID=3239917 RepID=UPI003D8DFDB3